MTAVVAITTKFLNPGEDLAPLIVVGASQRHKKTLEFPLPLDLLAEFSGRTPGVVVVSVPSHINKISQLARKVNRNDDRTEEPEAE
ncbi:hypothetical protein [uncultured Pigmentiphaga sp.]|uniref:hypothetical protein n=1 Tax=uncultured Pigmentiphaga sp. TaxID=340361 RepID=UPI0026065397|nr:hypothetical protein [uncultured Pigmentiphaga sp.]